MCLVFYGKNHTDFLANPIQDKTGAGAGGESVGNEFGEHGDGRSFLKDHCGMQMWMDGWMDKTDMQINRFPWIPLGWLLTRGENIYIACKLIKCVQCLVPN